MGRNIPVAHIVLQSVQRHITRTSTELRQGVQENVRVWRHGGMSVFGGLFCQFTGGRPSVSTVLAPEKRGWSVFLFFNISPLQTPMKSS